MTPFNDRLVNI